MLPRNILKFCNCFWWLLRPHLQTKKVNCYITIYKRYFSCGQNLLQSVSQPGEHKRCALQTLGIGQNGRAVCTNMVVIEMHFARARGTKRLAPHTRKRGNRASCKASGMVTVIPVSRVQLYRGSAERERRHPSLQFDHVQSAAAMRSNASI